MAGSQLPAKFAGKCWTILSKILIGHPAVFTHFPNLKEQPS
jgi:hypothetical protein